MPDFYGGETIRCRRNVKDPDSGEYYDPTTSMKITINHALNGIEVKDEDMVGGAPPEENKGKYHYYYTLPVANGINKVIVQYTATDGSHKTIWKEEIKAR